MVNLFGQQGGQQQGQQQNQQGKNSQNFVQALTKFLQNGQGIGMQPQDPGSAIPGAFGQTSVGGANGPTPLMPSSNPIGSMF